MRRRKKERLKEVGLIWMSEREFDQVRRFVWSW